MDVTGYYDPPVYYSKNGDGNPALIELEDGISEDWLEEEIEEKLGIKVKVSTELSNE